MIEHGNDPIHIDPSHESIYPSGINEYGGRRDDQRDPSFERNEY